VSNKKIIPITRLNKFFSDADLELQVRLGREYIESYNNFTVILFRVDRSLTKPDFYGEVASNEIRFLSPIELKVMPEIAAPENKSYNDNGSMRYLEDGNLTFLIYDSQLKERAIDINYGDYIGYPISETEIRYYTVVNDGKKNYDDEHTIMGYKGVFRTITCAIADKNEFDGK
jgi:hypothetical protein